ncbi:hypothetical protein NDU88_005639 [Pleurodeles waltl]|uniref:Uncharacterized protein n=1 Tax=Pleurodeles waltl TaxID=8319 RepID=A0AAV7MAK3_PLEWA|nr:hypothetical protein NDU88_005639 [Pleurodeles waltl]
MTETALDCGEELDCFPPEKWSATPAPAEAAPLLKQLSPTQDNGEEEREAKESLLDNGREKKEKKKKKEKTPAIGPLQIGMGYNPAKCDLQVFLQARQTRMAHVRGRHFLRENSGS